MRDSRERGSRARRAAGPVGLVLGVMLALWLLTGVSLAAGLTYLAYEAAFIVLPGWIAYRALTAYPGGPLRQLVLGWALGYVVELAFFMLTAATDTRELLPVYPLIVLAGGGLAARRRRADLVLRSRPTVEEADLRPGVWRWGLAAAAVVALLYVLGPHYATSTMPDRDPEVAHFWDYEWHLAMAGEAKHHWPVTEPAVSGERKPYHTFVYMHLAAASQITGQELPLVYFRLYSAPLLVLFTLALALLGRSVGRHGAVGLIAAGLAILVGEVDLDPGTSRGNLSLAPFWGFFTYNLHLSPSFFFGIVLLVPLLLVTVERIASEERAGPGPWVVLVLLAIGCGNAKAPILPVLISGTAIFGLWRLLRDRVLDRAALWVGSLFVLVLGAIYLLQYRGHSTTIVVRFLDFLNTSHALPPVQTEMLELLPRFPFREGMLEVLGAVAMLAFLIGAPTVGLWLLFRRMAWSRSRIFLLAVGLGALLQAIVLIDPTGPNLLYPLFYGLIPLIVLSADGLWSGWHGHREAIVAALPRLAPIALIAAAAIAALIAVPEVLGLFREGENAVAHLVMLSYGGLLLALLGTYLVARWRAGPGPGAALAIGLLLLVGFAGGPFDYLRSTVLTPHDPDLIGKTLNREQLDALEWIRDETDPDDVIAVNNYSLDAGTVPSFYVFPYYNAYSAYSERRAFIGGWRYSPRALGDVADGGSGLFVYADRLALNKSAYRADAAALQELRSRYGVRYLLDDKVAFDLHTSPCLYRLGRVAVSNPSIAVLELPDAVEERAARRCVRREARRRSLAAARRQAPDQAGQLKQESAPAPRRP